MTATSVSPRVLGGRYELRALIGQGTFGRVYRGHDRRLGRPVAVKVIKPWWTEDPKWAARFEREAQLMARVSHPGIVQIYDIGRDEGDLYYVAELIDGESLAERLKRGPLPASQARELAEQLCRALAQAHAQRVVHRDIKPANVLIDAGGRVKVGDFGIARLAEGSSEGPAGTVLGTPRYMAPEQALGRATTSATDVYGAGVVLYEMLAGRPPFTEASAVELALRHLSDPPPALPAGIPPALAQIVTRALAKEPAERYPSAREMADALSGARLAGRGPAGGEPATATLVGARLAPRRNFNPLESRRYALLLAGVVLILLGMIGAAVLTATSRVRAPQLRGLTRSAATARARRSHLRAAFTSRYSQALPIGTVVSQRPAAGSRVDEGSTLRVVLSAGPAPVPVPQVVGQRLADAQAILARLGLVGAPTQVPAPGVTPGLVVGQAPKASLSARLHSTVALSVAEVPRWRPLTAFSGDGAGQSVPFRIRGTRWRIVYGMSFDGACSWLSFFCSGPNVQVQNVTTGQALSPFALNDASGQSQLFSSGPGLYQVSVVPGDSAHWTIQVEDDY